MPPAPVAIITAASKGMGAACARLLAQRGYHLALFARGPELGNLATELDALAVTGDLADPAAIEQLVRQTQQQMLQRGVFVTSLTRQRKRAMQRLLQIP